MAEISKSNWIREKLGEKKWKKLVEFMKGLEYGSITLIVQDGKVIQIEKNEKVRILD